jgi:hypothetical protein
LTFLGVLKENKFHKVKYFTGVGGVVEGQGYVGVLRKLKEATQILHF